jgi:hypothetical protein
MCNGATKAGIKLAFGCQATMRTGSFENQDFLTGLRQVSGTGQPVVPGSDDDGVIARHLV